MMYTTEEEESATHSSTLVTVLRELVLAIRDLIVAVTLLQRDSRNREHAS